MKPLCSSTYQVTRYVVAACGEEPRGFDVEGAAREAARAAARRCGWADYYRVVGEPVTDLWRKPELLGGFERAARLRSAALAA